MLACCTSSAIPQQFITKICGEWTKQDVFITHVKYGSEKSRVHIPSKSRSLLTLISNLLEGPGTPSEKLIDYEVVQVASGYHEIFKEVCLPPKGKRFLITMYIH